MILENMWSLTSWACLNCHALGKYVDLQRRHYVYLDVACQVADIGLIESLRSCTLAATDGPISLHKSSFVMSLREDSAATKLNHIIYIVNMQSEFE
jgi:hypothetical protein